jgi:hypothetical protein
MYAGRHDKSPSQKGLWSVHMNCRIMPDKGNDKNIAVLLRYFHGLPLD